MPADKRPGAILFITSDYEDLELNRPLLTLWTHLSIPRLMSMQRTNSLRTWFVFDELAALKRLPAIETGLQTARHFGGAMPLGLTRDQNMFDSDGEDGHGTLA